MEAERKAELVEIAEKQRQREKEGEEKELRRSEASLLGRHLESVARPVVPAPVTRQVEPVAAAASAAAPTIGKYVPRFRMEKTESSTVAPPTEPDRWGRQEDGPQFADKWRSNRRPSAAFGGGPRSSSSCAWSSSRRP